MRERQYRLKTSTLVITIEDGKKTSFTIPRGGEVDMLGQLSGFVWKRKTINLFTTAIRKQGEEFDGPHE